MDKQIDQNVSNYSHMETKRIVSKKDNIDRPTITNKTRSKNIKKRDDFHDEKLSFTSISNDGNDGNYMYSDIWICMEQALKLAEKNNTSRTPSASFLRAELREEFKFPNASIQFIMNYNLQNGDDHIKYIYAFCNKYIILFDIYKVNTMGGKQSKWISNQFVRIGPSNSSLNIPWYRSFSIVDYGHHFELVVSKTFTTRFRQIDFNLHPEFKNKLHRFSFVPLNTNKLYESDECTNKEIKQFDKDSQPLHKKEIKQVDKDIEFSNPNDYQLRPSNPNDYQSRPSIHVITTDKSNKQKYSHSNTSDVLSEMKCQMYPKSKITGVSQSLSPCVQNHSPDSQHPQHSQFKSCSSHGSDKPNTNSRQTRATISQSSYNTQNNQNKISKSEYFYNSLNDVIRKSISNCVLDNNNFKFALKKKLKEIEGVIVHFSENIEILNNMLLCFDKKHNIFLNSDIYTHLIQHDATARKYCIDLITAMELELKELKELENLFTLQLKELN